LTSSAISLAIVSDAEKAAKAAYETPDRLSIMIALDQTDLLVIRWINRSALNLVAADQGDCLSFFVGPHPPFERLKAKRQISN